MQSGGGVREAAPVHAQRGRLVGVRLALGIGIGMGVGLGLGLGLALGLGLGLGLELGLGLGLALGLGLGPGLKRGGAPWGPGTARWVRPQLPRRRGAPGSG